MTRLGIVEKEKCNSIGCGDFLCIRVCPVNKMGRECIVRSLNKKSEINEELCTGCGICVHKCPFSAIHIVNLPEKLKEEPIHRFGKNSFELFSLPVPKRGRVVGIVGRNGIGKSTALGVLSGQVKPNLGKYDKEVSEKEVLGRFAGSALGNYFSELYSNKVKVSYKPQRVELLRSAYNGKVDELLKRIDERKKAKEFMKELDMESVYERDIQDLSGGELQRLAIIAAAVKKADVYYFDEPTSFVDIMHRVKIARLLRELAKDSAVIVVEHDLATLDYISDEIHIVYGEAACYGVFSQAKAVRRGINEYLDGYLPDDNVRFRDYAIKFSEAPEEITYKQEALVEFPELKKSFESFELRTASGRIRKSEVLCIMGGNGLGKTTFLKMLAGELKPDSGSMESIKIAYKPQYLEQDINLKVEEYLRSAAKEEYNSGWYQTNILEKLNLNPILQNKVRDLSGGELQKVHIAATLSAQDIDLLAMDEPSAFIDVEDRLKVAEIIKEFVLRKEISAIVVDHDIQFVDFLADSMLVFSGVSGHYGRVEGPFRKRDGMNLVLKNLDITYRRDKETLRPRINKPGSQLDVEQRNKGEYYYN